MKKYNDVVVKGFEDVSKCKDKSVEEVIESLCWEVEDELKKWKKSFEGGKKYVIVGKIGCRGLYEGIEVIREGEVLLEKDLVYGSDYWKFRKEMLEELKEDLEDGIWSKEEYDELVMLYREGSNDDVYEESLCGCINEEYGDDDYIGCEFNDDEVWYYYIVNRLRKEDKV